MATPVAVPANVFRGPAAPRTVIDVDVIVLCLAQIMQPVYCAIVAIRGGVAPARGGRTTAALCGAAASCCCAASSMCVCAAENC